MNVRAGLLVVGLSFVACGGTPPPPVVPDGEYEYEFEQDKTGEPMAVKGKSFVYTTNERVEIAQRDMYDSQGRRIGSDRLYANQEVAHQGYSWTVYQGSKPIDVLSALHIARDEAFRKAFPKRIEQINEDRVNALPYYEKVMKDTAGARTVGLGLGIAGVAAGLALIVVGAATKPDNGSVSPGFTYGATGLIIVGGVGFGIMGAMNTKRRNGAAHAQEMANSHVSDSDFPRLTTEAYMTEVAERYNDGMAAPPPPPPKKDTKKDTTKKKKPKH
jgi:hypothetical protein